MIVLILANGLGFFWPRPVAQVTLKDGTVLMGEVVGPRGHSGPGHAGTPPAVPHPAEARQPRPDGRRLQLGGRGGHRADRDARPTPCTSSGASTARSSAGSSRLTDGDREVASGSEAALAIVPSLVREAERDRALLRSLERDEIGEVNYRMEQARLRGRKLDLEARQKPGGRPGAAEARSWRRPWPPCRRSTRRSRRAGAGPWRRRRVPG